ncbi:MAG TPA: response regulator transcription factor [Candidatus Polarisedimenticolia bacterium]|nr:response regulator transcription factor [Candidatus Polarisedimenticolia bacterium]
MRVLITDDHPLVRRGLRAMLAEHPEWELCGEASNGQEAVQKAVELRPHVVIMDISMPGLSGLQATRQIREVLPDTEVLILTLHESREMIQAAKAAGARGFLVKSDPDHQLIKALETVCRHEPFFPSRWGEDTNGGHRHG